MNPGFASHSPAHAHRAHSSSRASTHAAVSRTAAAPFFVSVSKAAPPAARRCFSRAARSSATAAASASSRECLMSSAMCSTASSTDASASSAASIAASCLGVTTRVNPFSANGAPEKSRRATKSKHAAETRNRTVLRRNPHTVRRGPCRLPRLRDEAVWRCRSDRRGGACAPPLPSASSNERPRDTKPPRFSFPPAARPARAFASGLLNSSSSYAANGTPASRSRSETSMTLPNAPVRRAESRRARRPSRPGEGPRARPPARRPTESV